MNNRHIQTLIALLMLCALAACAPTPPPAPTAVATITTTPQPASTPQPTLTPITYPMRLEYVGGFGGIADALALSDYRIYLKVGPRVVTVDVSDPYHPKEMGHSDVSIEDIDLIDTSVDGHVLVQDKEATLWEFEALPDGNLTLLHAYGRNDPVRPEMDATYELAAVGGGYRFEYDPDSLDYSGAQPLTVYQEGDAGEVITSVGSLPAGVIAASKIIAARGRYVYIAVSYGLAIYDIGVNPDRPFVWGPMEGNRKTMWREVATLRTMAMSHFFGMGGFGVPSVQVSDSYLRDEMGVWSLEDPENPVKIKNPSGIFFLCDDFPVEGGAIYSDLGYGLYTFLDMRNPDRYTWQRIATGIDGANNILVAGKSLLFVGSGYEYGSEEYTLNVLDVSDPFNPKPLSSYPIQGHQYYDGYSFIGDYLYITPATSETPVILDLTDPTKPHLVDTSVTPLPTWSQPIVYGNWIIDLQSDHLLMYSSNDIFTPVSDITIPEAGWFVGQPTNPSCFNDKLYVHGGGDAIFYGSGNTFYVLGIGDTVHPQLLARMDLPSDWPVADIASYGDYLYLAGWGGGVRIYKLVPN